MPGADESRLGWVRFEIDWHAAVGGHTLMTRASDVAGSTQRDVVPFNRKGYLSNQSVPHPIDVV